MSRSERSEKQDKSIIIYYSMNSDFLLMLILHLYGCIYSFTWWLSLGFKKSSMLRYSMGSSSSQCGGLLIGLYKEDISTRKANYNNIIWMNLQKMRQNCLQAQLLNFQIWLMVCGMRSILSSIWKKWWYSIGRSADLAKMLINYS